MGKMKEKFMEEQEQLIREAVEAFVDDDWQYQEYLDTLGKAISQKESQANHDAWWNSLTDEQKQQLYLDQEESINESNDDTDKKINKEKPLKKSKAKSKKKKSKEEIINESNEIIERAITVINSSEYDKLLEKK